MKSLSVTLLAVLALSGLAVSTAHAQVPTGSTDLHVYLPTVGKASEIDTLLGSLDGQEMANSMSSFPSAPGSNVRTIVIGNIHGKGAHTQATFLAQPPIDIHHLRETHVSDFDFTGRVKAGHFHDSRHIDLYLGSIIYWGNDSGTYSEDRSIRLPGLGYFTGYLTSDTVEDIILDTFVLNPNRNGNWQYATLVKGGEGLYQKGKLGYRDSIILVDTSYFNNSQRGGFWAFQGDWRGVGREDLIMTDPFGSMFYYRNDPPFTMEKLQKAWKDTLYSAPVSGGITYLGPGESLTMRAMPHGPGDSSKDLLVVKTLADRRGRSVLFFKGHSEFGSRRLTPDSAAFILPNPGYYNSIEGDGSYGEQLVDCGDMTGNGDHVLLVEGAPGYSLQDLSLQFYLTGRSLDPWIDMYYYMPNTAGYAAVDTLDANGDGLTDALIGVSGYTRRSNLELAGSLHLVYGTKKIPHPTRSVAGGAAQHSRQLSIWPNPARELIAVQFEAPAEDRIRLTIRNLLGEAVLTRDLSVSQGFQSVPVTLPNLASGLYTIELRGERQFETGRLVIEE